MSDPQRDARVRELVFLAEIERTQQQRVSRAVTDMRERQMVMYLVDEGYLNGTDAADGLNDIRADPTSHLRQIWRQRVTDLRLGHKGRLRIAELESALSTGRDRDPTGTFVSRRYFERDLVVALVFASEQEPVSLAVVDMNGLKTINDAHGHGAGDDAIRTYLAIVAALLPEGATGYRGDGGDEVFIIGRALSATSLAGALRGALTKLGGETVRGVSLSAACGVRSTIFPNEESRTFCTATDAEMYRAKEASKKREPRVSTLAVSGSDVEVLSVSHPP